MAAPDLVNLSSLIDDAQRFAPVRQRRRPEGVRGPGCGSGAVVRHGCDDTQPHRQRYRCKTCAGRFDDLTGTVLAGPHQPLRVWVLGPYLMGLNLSSRQIAGEPGLGGSDHRAGHDRAAAQRLGVAEAPAATPGGEVEIDQVYGRGRAQGPTGGRRGKGRPGRRRRLAGAPGRGTLAKDKPPILGMIQRGGQVVMRMLATVRRRAIRPIIEARVAEGARVHTDEGDIYARLEAGGYSRIWGDEAGGGVSAVMDDVTAGRIRHACRRIPSSGGRDQEGRSRMIRCWACCVTGRGGC